MVVFKRVAIVGVGLIGGSLALSARNNGVFNSIVGISRKLGNLRKAKELGVVDDYTVDLAEGIRSADLVVVATPVSTIIPLIEQMLPHLKEKTIITDVGSVKKTIVRDVDTLPLSGAYFVGGHPIAGTENSGVEAAVPHLYNGRKCILTPSKRTNPVALQKVRDLWMSVGADVITMDSERHDKIMAAVSHLPHMIAFTLVNFLSDLDDAHENIFSFSAGGLKDFTRIAASDPVMWRDIALMNKSNIVELIDKYLKTLYLFKDLINREDSGGLQEEMQKSRTIRRNLMR